MRVWKGLIVLACTASCGGTGGSDAFDGNSGSSSTTAPVPGTSSSTSGTESSTSGADETAVDEPKLDLAVPDFNPPDPMMPTCNVVDDMDAVGACGDEAPPDSFEPVIQVLAEADPAGRNAYVLGLGAALLYEAQGDPARALQTASLHGPEEGALRAVAIGRAGTGWWLPPAALEERVNRTLESPLAGAFREGLGRAAFHTLVLTPAGIVFVQEPTLLRPAAGREAAGRRAGTGEEWETVVADDVLRGFDAEAATWGR